MPRSVFVLKNSAAQDISIPNEKYYINTDTVAYSYESPQNNLFFGSAVNCVLCTSSAEYDTIVSVRVSVIMELLPVRLGDEITVGLVYTDEDDRVVFADMNERLGFYKSGEPLLNTWKDSFHPISVIGSLRVKREDVFIGAFVSATQKGGKTADFYKKKVLQCTLEVKEQFKEPVLQT